MGGYGSGRYGGRPTADASLKIDLAWMMRNGHAKEGCCKAGALHWSCGGRPSGSISYTAIMDEPGAERLELSYTRGEGSDRENVRQTVRLTFTRPNYGGKRWWMICPYQHIRAAKLYKPGSGDRFASRQAWRLGYQIQRVAHEDRSREALFSLQAKLGCARGIDNWPRRPKGMWRRTWERHFERLIELEERANDDFTVAAARIISRCQRASARRKR